ncbi:MAG: adenylosuccinate lyase [Bacteroidia bacterium]|nr:adenylosuccinate lyase [Bacteroidia bacterium]MDW8345879.1 adenylosuccinate lyase [Bacteroidia bacterium]
MELKTLTAISAIDGRYRDKVKELSAYFSEYALHVYRVKVEIEYFIALTEEDIPALSKFPSNAISALRNWANNLTYNEIREIKAIEKTTNHDVKAVEYFIKQKFEDLELGEYKEYVHFGLTSQDINNTAIPLLLQAAHEKVYLPQLDKLISNLKDLANLWKKVPMLARTHGQPASPTRLGKEIKVFVERLEKQKELLQDIPFSAKFGGAIGNFNAHYAAFPNIDWIGFANKLINQRLGLYRSQTTTQIEHYDNLAAYCDALRRINNILIDFARDMWQYISYGYFSQKIKAEEVGSSAMPHKVNPIDFENAEGNLGYANAIFEFMSNKLPISRLQRDLTDSTVLRNLGVPIAHTYLAMKSLISGLKKIEINLPAIKKDLNDNWAVVAEAIQTILRRENYPNPYEKLKLLTRVNRKITQEDILQFIDSLDISEELKNELKSITPFNYTGI